MTNQTILKIKPQGPQDIFLRSPAQSNIYGGASGGGKTYSLSFEALRYRNVPGFGAVIFRRNATRVRNKGGLWDTSFEHFRLLVATQKKRFWSGNFLQVQPSSLIIWSMKRANLIGRVHKFLSLDSMNLPTLREINFSICFQGIDPPAVSSLISV